MKDNALYLEADEDITSAIDKLRKAPGESVQIVVPKRSTLLQSIINLRLLKKAADTSGKQLVLVTNDRVSTELAGRAGLLVAAAVNARPVISSASLREEAPEPEDDVIEEVDDDAAEAAAAKPSRAAARAEKKAAKKAAAVESADSARLADSDRSADEPKEKGRGLFTRRELGAAAAQRADETAEPPRDDFAARPGHDRYRDGGKPAKAPKIPNYSRLPLIALGVGAIVTLVAGYFIGMYFYSSAKVTLYAAASKVSVSATFKADPTLIATDVTNAKLAAKSVVEDTDLTAKATATGKKDIGTKASGTITIKNCEDTNTHTLKAGNVFSSQGKNFISDNDVIIGAASFTNGGKTCAAGTGSVHVTAAENGDSYNLTSANFSNALLTSNYTLTGSMAGGTSKVVTVLTQADVDSARDAALAKDKDGASARIEKKTDDGYMVLTDSLKQTAGDVTADPAVGEEADSADLVIKVAYSALAVKSADFTAMLEALEQKQVGAENQVYENGLSSAKIKATGVADDSTGARDFTVTTDAYGGAKIDAAVVAKNLKGLKYGDALNKASAINGVSKSEIVLWPIWSTNLPSRVEQIKVDIKVSGLRGN